jgi:hypothetical protein
MSVSASTQIPKTSDPAVFQRQCKVLFEHVLDDPHVEEFGTTGQGQKGIDLLGRRRSQALDHWVAIQCKLTIKAEKLKTGPKGVVAIEGARALSFQPILKELIIATTAANDAVIQREAALFTDAQAKLGRDFTVQVWGWETLSTHIPQYERALNAFMPDAFPQLERVIRGQAKLTEYVGSFIDAHNSVAAEQHSLLVQIQQQTAGSIALRTIWDDRSVGTLIDHQIDHLRDMLNDGRPRTALEMLEGLWAGLPPAVDGRVRFRIKANIAACLLRLGDEKTAAETYLEAYQHTPNDPKAISLKVLAHVLLNQPEKALAFGRTVLTGGADQGPLIAYMISAAKLLPDEEPLSFITEAVLDDPAVAVAKIDYLRTQGEPGAWWEFARERSARYPNDENLARAAAEADIDRAAQWSEANDRRPLHAELRATASKATAILDNLLEKFAGSEVAWNDYLISLSVNLAIGHRLLGNSNRATQVLEAALLKAPNDQAVKQALFAVSIEIGDDASARRALNGLAESRDLTFGRLQLAANEGDWASIVQLYEKVDLSSLDTDDRALLEALTLLARANLGAIDDAKAEAAALLERYPNEAIIPTILYQLAVRERDGVWATELFQTACAKRDPGNSATRMMLARLAEREENYEKIIELLDERIDTTRDTAELRLLARAFVNSAVRTASITFIDALPASLKTEAFYARVIGSINFNRGDLPTAADFFQKALNADSADVAAHIGLINTWLRQDRRDLVAERLVELDPDKLKGSPSNKMALAQIFVAFGLSDRGLSFGYNVAVNSRNDQRAVMLYIGLILPNPSGAIIPAVGDTVSVDCWVKAERWDGHVLEFVIENAPNRNDPDHLNLHNPFARLFLGQLKGATIVTAPTIGTEESWRIVDVKHKYLALLHEFIEVLPSRFPDAKGLYRFNVKDGDLTGFLAEVKRIGEQDEQIFRYYVDDRFPLALVASFRGKSTVEFAEHVIGRGELIRTCVGNVNERNAAMRSVHGARARGIVLDTYTAWIAQQLGLLDTLKALFSRVALPRSSIDELRQWAKHLEPQGDEPLMTIGYSDGKHFREEIPAERLREGVTRISAGIEEICDKLEILPAVAPAAPSDFEEKLLDIGRHGFLDPVYIGLADDLLLVCDDLQYRVIAKELHGREGAWLQSVLMVACDIGALDRAGYAEAVYSLAAQKHSHVALTTPVLIQIALLDASANLAKLQVVAAYIGNETADFQSHLSVAWGSIVGLWKTDLPYLRKAKATNIMLERLVEMLHRFGELKNAYPHLIELSRRQPLLNDYLISWARGHFLEL